MGLEDSQLFLADKKAVGASVTTDVIDLVHPYNDDACGYLQLVGHKIVGATSVTITLQDSPDNSTFTNRETVTSSNLVDINKGNVHVGLGKPLHRYVRAVVAIAGDGATGSFSAFLTDKISRENHYPASSQNSSSPY